MKKMVHELQTKCSVINLVNLCAFALMVSSVNAACIWIHHQPKVPEEAKKYRKF